MYRRTCRCISTHGSCIHSCMRNYTIAYVTIHVDTTHKTKCNFMNRCRTYLIYLMAHSHSVQFPQTKDINWHCSSFTYSSFAFYSFVSLFVGSSLFIPRITYHVQRGTRNIPRKALHLIGFKAIIYALVYPRCGSIYTVSKRSIAIIIHV